MLVLGKAEVKAMRPKAYTPAGLGKRADRYFRSISRRVEVKERIPTGERDESGHEVFREETVLNQLGRPIIVTEYLEPPTVAGLCAFLGIHRATWAVYADSVQHPEFSEVTREIKDRLMAWNERELLTRDGKNVKGIVFNLQQNYGYGGEKVEHDFGKGLPVITPGFRESTADYDE